MTDVNIAVELRNDAYDDRFDTTLLISGDSDLTSPVRAVLDRHPRKRVIVGFPPGRNSVQLIKAATGYFRPGRKILHDSQFPETVRKPNGFLLERPPEWS